jgi:ABC-2 type transport system ATP-binding protein
MNTLEVKNITKYYGKQLVLNNISFGLQTGEIVGLLGPNGAGKSTLMRVITGYVQADSGEVEVCGQKVNASDYKFKHNIGYLPGSNPLYYDMYVPEYLNYTAEMYQIDGKRERVEEMIILTGLSKERNKRIGQLSEGYKQRVGIAQAIIHNPKLLILDEPTTGLDPNQTLEIRELISNIGKNHTIIFSTHILQEVSAICSRVLLINLGNIISDVSGNDLTINKLENMFRIL